MLQAVEEKYHGTLYGYRKYRCRCRDCREAESRYKFNRKQERLSDEVLRGYYRIEKPITEETKFAPAAYTAPVRDPKRAPRVGDVFLDKYGRIRTITELAFGQTGVVLVRYRDSGNYTPPARHTGLSTQMPLNIFRTWAKNATVLEVDE